jgi:hypothetical protein
MISKTDIADGESLYLAMGAVQKESTVTIDIDQLYNEGYSLVIDGNTDTLLAQILDKNDHIVNQFELTEENYNQYLETDVLQVQITGMPNQCDTGLIFH